MKNVYGCKVRTSSFRSLSKTHLHGFWNFYDYHQNFVFVVFMTHVTRKLQFFSREIQNAKPRLQVGEDGCSIHHGRCLCQVHISSIRSLSKLPYRTSEVFMIINPLRTLLIVPSLHEKCPNTEFLLVRIFPHLDQKKLRIWFRHFSRCAPKTKSFYRWTNELWTAQFKR